ncbi:MAG: holo-ACP synthase [Actinomycetota bacterium]|nr:holo-ACP synthase [Actinomycetota bacterium]
MDILGVGVDVVDVARMQRALERHPTFAERVFTEEEIAYCTRGGTQAECYAGRFAAREAVIKALGGLRGAKWRDISVARQPSGAPSILLAGAAAARASMLGVERLLISFTHERNTAVAFCIAVGG